MDTRAVLEPLAPHREAGARSLGARGGQWPCATSSRSPLPRLAVGVTGLHPSRFDMDTCTYHFSWDTRAACAVKPQEVQMVNGTITNPVNGRSVSLGDIYFK